MICKRDLPHVETLLEWIIDLEVSMGSDTSYNECMQEEAVKGIQALFCNREESVLIFSSLLKFIVKWTCEAAVDEWQGDMTACNIFTFLRQHTRGIVRMFSFVPFICDNISNGSKTGRDLDKVFKREIFEEISHQGENRTKILLTKRQYDLSSMMKFLENLVCDRSTFLQIAKYVEEEVIESEDGMTEVASLLHGFICCTLVAIHTD